MQFLTMELIYGDKMDLKEFKKECAEYKVNEDKTYLKCPRCDAICNAAKDRQPIKGTTRWQRTIQIHCNTHSWMKTNANNATGKVYVPFFRKKCRFDGFKWYTIE